MITDDTQDGPALRKRKGSNSSMEMAAKSNIVVEKVQLKKSVGLVSGTSLIVGTIIGK